MEIKCCRLKETVLVTHRLDGCFPPLYLVCKRELLMWHQPSPAVADQMPDNKQLLNSILRTDQRIGTI